MVVDAWFVHQEILSRLLERLQLVKNQPKAILIYGVNAEYWEPVVQTRYPAAQIDVARTITALPKDTYQLVLVNLALHYEQDYLALFKAWQSVLSEEGSVFFSAFGPDTLRELKRSFAKVDSHPHVMNFIDMHDLGDELLKSGLVDPVMDAEQLTIDYPDFSTLCRDLQVTRLYGYRSQNGLMGKQKWQQVAEYYQAHFSDEEGLLVTVEVIFANAWMKPVTNTASLNEDNEAVVPISAIKKTSA